MATSLTVPKILNYPPSMNYTLLRQEGMRQLERLGAAIWTDFNSHDPGVTMLEVLCYALTDLGYRTQFPDADLFTPTDGRKAFFTAAQILPNAPVTALDFRKILIDIEGIKNAWIEGCDKPNVLFQWLLDKPITLQLPDFDHAKLKKAAAPAVFALKEIPNLENELRKIDSLKKEEKQKATARLRGVIAEYINEKVLTDAHKQQWLLHHAEHHLAQAYQWVSESKQGMTDKRNDVLNQLSQAAKALKYVKRNADAKEADVVKKAKTFWKDLPKQLEDVQKEVAKDKALSYYFFVNPVWPQIANALTIRATDSPVPYSLFSHKGIYKVFVQLEEGHELEKDKIKAAALRRLHENRALSEDFGGITVVDKAPLCVHTRLELTPDADPVQVYAELLYAIENFLSPPVPMYSLQEMIDKQTSQSTTKTYDAHYIFQGPLLRHGFIDDTELEAATWRRVVYQSDLFQLVSKVPNVRRVTALRLHKSPQDDQNPATVEKEWCLSFDCDCQPTLDEDCSEFVFVVGGRPWQMSEADQYEVQDRLAQLRAQDAKIDRQGALDLPVPTDTLRPDLADYTSIQEEFPRTYHVGREGIAAHHSAVHKAEVKQLKGFLLFFDQLLANYLRHLSEIRNMLATEQQADKWELYQTLYDVPNVSPLLMAFEPNGKSTWEEFKTDPDNGYLNALKNLTNGSNVTQQLRQNQIIDHLLSRFGEQFTDHALQLFQIEMPLEDTTEASEGLTDWLTDKRRMLKNVPRLGRLRGRGFNYRPTPQDDFKHFWDSDNEAGFKQRVLAQLGVGNWQRRTVSCSPQFFADTRLETVGKTKRYRFGVKKDENAPSFWLLSTASYSQEEAANRAADDFYAQAADTARYAIIEHEKQFWVGFWPTAAHQYDNALLLSTPKTQPEADQLLREIKRYIVQQCQRESFHVVEHILLRPADEHYDLLNTTGSADTVFPTDPYSFWISVVVPGWVELFQSPRFEELVRSEVPAHVAIRFSYLPQAEMLDFEEAYFEWLKRKTNPNTEDFDLREATNRLIGALNKSDKKQ